MDFYIYALDIAYQSVAPKKGNTSWIKLNSNGDLIDTGYNIVQLASNIASDLNNKEERVKVALGFEAPMWLPIPKMGNGNNFKMNGRFYDELQINLVRWFEGGAQPTVKTLPIGYFLFHELLKQCNNINATTDIDDWDISHPLYLFEGFATENYKGNKSPDYIYFQKNDKRLKNNDLVDAYVIAQACYQSITKNFTPFFPTSKIKKIISWHHHLEVKEARTAPRGKATIETKHLDHRGTIIHYSSCISHFRFISIWNIIREQVISDKDKFIINGPNACDIYGFYF